LRVRAPLPSGFSRKAILDKSSDALDRVLGEMARPKKDEADK
jgi:hypothetical protein